MTYTIKFPIGDWSDDGHGQCEYFYIRSNKTARELDELTESVQKKLGFAIGDICEEYEESALSDAIIEHLEEAGFDLKTVNSRDDFDIEDDMDAELVFLLWMAILKHIDPSFEYELFDPDEDVQHIEYRNIPGYGVFSG